MDLARNSVDNFVKWNVSLASLLIILLEGLGGAVEKCNQASAVLLVVLKPFYTPLNYVSRCTIRGEWDTMGRFFLDDW